MKRLAILFITLFLGLALWSCGGDENTPDSKSVSVPDQETCTHSFDSWKISTAATCTKEGEEIRICTKCTLAEKRATDKAAHSPKDVSRKESTCSEQGHESGVQCTVCGAAISGMAAIAKKPHSYVDRKCTVCDELQISQGLIYEPYGGDGYTVSGIGECTDTVIAIPTEHNGMPVRKIGENAFENLNITKVYLPETLYWIEESAFSGCASLTELVIPESVTEIGNYAFYGCDGLVTVENGIEYVDNWAIFGEGENVVIRNGTVGIANSSFSFNSDLLSVQLPSSLKYIGVDAFLSCNNLVNVNIPSDIEIIAGTAFSGCDSAVTVENGLHYIDKILVGADSSLKEAESITVRSGTLAIGEGVFTDFTNLKSIEIPSSVRIINSFAFSWCSSLTSVRLPNGLVFVGYYAFDNCNNLKSISLGDSVKYISNGAFGSINVTVSEDNPYFTAENGAVSPKK